MNVEFGKMRRGEVRQAAELAARAFDDYEYFTNWFPEAESRHRVLFSIIWHEYKTNFNVADYLVARQDGRLVAVAQLDAPTYRKPSDLRYLLHGWLKVYGTGDRKTIDDWLAMDAAAGKPCPDYQKTGAGIWYASSLTVDPGAQGTGIGTRFLEYWEEYIRERGGSQIVFFTNSRANLDFYTKRGYQVFDEREFGYNGKTIGSWSLRKKL
jgi:GNAT superfamily N-acetyltransferase